MGDFAEKPECKTLNEDRVVWGDMNMAGNAFLIFNDTVRMRKAYCSGGKGASVFKNGCSVMLLWR